MKLEHKQFGSYEIVDLKQRHVEEYWAALGDLKDIKIIQARRVAIEAAIKAGWFVNPPEGDMKEQLPGFVAWLGDALANHFASVMEIPPS